MANIFYFVCVINYTRLSYVGVCGITMDYCSNREHYNMKLYFQEEKKMKNNFKRLIAIVFCVTMLIAMSGCSMIESKINDIKGSLVGNGYDIYTYDNYGELVMKTSGDKISLSGNKTETTSYDSDGSTITNYEMSSVVTITVDGHEIESCGDTCIFEQNGLNAEIDFTQEVIDSQTDGSFDENTAIARFVNKYKNMFGKSRVVVVKSQLGQPITAYSGDDVYWEIPDDLPKMTKLMIDGKALYIHRANFQIIDKALLD